MPRHPPHMDTKMSWAEAAYSDEMDEEFDTFPTSKAQDVVQMRYDRLRSVAGRIQMVIGDMVTQGERLQPLLSWQDPRATSVFFCSLSGCCDGSLCDAVQDCDGGGVVFAQAPEVSEQDSISAE